MTLNYEKVWEALNNLEMMTCKICSAREILDSAINALENGNKEKVETLMYATNEFLEYYLKEFDEKFKIAWGETVVKIKQAELSWEGWNDSDSNYNHSYLTNNIPTQDRVSNFPGEQYTDEELNAMCDAAENSIVGATTVSMFGDDVISFDLPQEKPDKVVRWQLPVECDGPSGEYYITFPDDLLEAANLKEGEEVEWVDNGDGSFILRKPQKETFIDPYEDEMIAAGYEKIDGVWSLSPNVTYDQMIAAGYEMTADGFWIKP
jgi:bifunctional DNA-binding transcriptional regulator/antitoxin component of YhaV-PrlF toxin-antitoxin module